MLNAIGFDSENIILGNYVKQDSLAPVKPKKQKTHDKGSDDVSLYKCVMNRRMQSLKDFIYDKFGWILAIARISTVLKILTYFFLRQTFNPNVNETCNLWHLLVRIFINVYLLGWYLYCIYTVLADDDTGYFSLWKVKFVTVICRNDFAFS